MLERMPHWWNRDLEGLNDVTNSLPSAISDLRMLEVEDHDVEDGAIEPKFKGLAVPPTKSVLLPEDFENCFIAASPVPQSPANRRLGSGPLFIQGRAGSVEELLEVAVVLGKEAIKSKEAHQDARRPGF